MFAKVFSQIFESSIAMDYSVRHMFMDLLVLSDAEGAVDMTYDAISRITNVPIEIVRRCIDQLCQPDPESRSPLHEGKRLVPIDSHRNWGWIIVNYEHYRKIRDEEARKAYFRDYQRERRSVKDKSLTKGDKVEPSSSTSSYSSEKGRPKDEQEVISFCKSISLTDGEYFWNKWVANDFTNNGRKMRDWRATIKSWKAAKYCPSQKDAAKKPKSCL